MLPRFLLLPFALAMPYACAQTNGAPTVDSVLNRLHTNALLYEANLPSLSCHEHITSQQMVNGRAKRVSDVQDVVRVLRTEDAKSPTRESRVPVNAAGEPQEGKHVPGMPLRLVNGIHDGQAQFDDIVDYNKCYDWKLDTSGSKLRLEMKRKPEAASCHHSGDGMEGFVLIDRASGQMVYQQHTLNVEWTMKLSRETHENRATFVETSYAPVVLGTQTLWLPTRIYSEFGPDRHYTAVYTDCQRYTASSRIVSVSPEP